MGEMGIVLTGRCSAKLFGSHYLVVSSGNRDVCVQHSPGPRVAQSFCLCLKLAVCRRALHSLPAAAFQASRQFVV